MKSRDGINEELLLSVSIFYLVVGLVGLIILCT